MQRVQVGLKVDDMKRIVILTGSELRHEYFRKTLAASPGILVVRSYCEDQQNDLRSQVSLSGGSQRLRMQHLADRETAEREAFQTAIQLTPDLSNPVELVRGEINSAVYRDEIVALEPDLVISYGCSIIREPLLSSFPRQFVNVHLGLSPYYRGSGTNYWPLVNNEPEYVGATFMFIDSGIDTGEIIHQIRAEVVRGDTPSSIGNRLIIKMTEVMERIIVRFEALKPLAQPSVPSESRYYTSKDFTEESVVALYKNFQDGLIDRYLEEKQTRWSQLPLIRNQGLQGEEEES